MQNDLMERLADGLRHMSWCRTCAEDGSHRCDNGGKEADAALAEYDVFKNDHIDNPKNSDIWQPPDADYYYYQIFVNTNVTLNIWKKEDGILRWCGVETCTPEEFAMVMREINAAYKGNGDVKGFV